MTMPTRAETLSNDLIAAVAGPARGDETSSRALIRRARERAEERIRDELKQKLDGTAGEHAATAAGARAAPGASTAKMEPRPPPPTAPVRSLRLRLPNGKQRRASVTPALVRYRDLEALRETTADNDRRAFQSLGRHRRALDEVARTLDELARA